MADSTGRILSSTEQMQANYEKYKDKFVDSDDDLVSADTFLQLLVGEMKYQDPLEPTSNTEFLSQLASFSQMGYMQDASKYSMATYASSLVGKIATATRVEGKNVISKTGIVESVSKTADNKSYTVTIDGETFDLSKVTGVKDAPSTGTGSGNESSGNVGSVTESFLGDSISRASMMIGMYATISGKLPDGNNYLDAGFIEAIRVMDGKIYVVINGSSRPIEDIVELTYATVDDGSGDTGKVENPEEGENPDETVDETDTENKEG